MRRSPHAFEDQRRTFSIGKFATVPFVIPLDQITRKVGLADRVVRAEHGALHEAEAALGGVDVHETAHAHIFVNRVIDGAMAGELAAD